MFQLYSERYQKPGQSKFRTYLGASLPLSNVGKAAERVIHRQKFLAVAHKRYDIYHNLAEMSGFANTGDRTLPG